MNALEMFRRKRQLLGMKSNKKAYSTTTNKDLKMAGKTLSLSTAPTLKKQTE